MLTNYEKNTIERTFGETTIELEPDGTLWIESGEREFRTDIWQGELLALRTCLDTPEVVARLGALRGTDDAPLPRRTLTPEQEAVFRCIHRAMDNYFGPDDEANQ